MTEEKALHDPLEAISEVLDSGKTELSLELFTEERPQTDGIALKTDLTHKEHVLVSVLATENELIKKALGQDFNLYKEFIEQFRRHKVSLDRKSREEFVRTVQGGISEKGLEIASNIKNITESRT